MTTCATWNYNVGHVIGPSFSTIKKGHFPRTLVVAYISSTICGGEVSDSVGITSVLCPLAIRRGLGCVSLPQVPPVVGVFDVMDDCIIHVLRGVDLSGIEDLREGGREGSRRDYLSLSVRPGPYWRV